MRLSATASRRRARAAPGLALAASLVASAGWGAAAPPGAVPESLRLRHAGTVLSVQPAAGRLVVEEMSPGNDLRRIVAQVEPTTSLVEIVREPSDVIVRAPGVVETVSTHRYVERSLDLATVSAGDFVVVVLEHPLVAGTPVPARRIELTARARPGAGSATAPAR